MRDYCNFMCCVFLGWKSWFWSSGMPWKIKGCGFFLLVTCIFGGKTVILIMTGCFKSVTVRVLTCSQIFLWEKKSFRDLCARRNPLPAYINSPVGFSSSGVVAFQDSYVFHKKALWTWHLVISPSNLRATFFLCYWGAVFNQLLHLANWI